MWRSQNGELNGIEGKNTALFHLLFLYYTFEKTPFIDFDPNWSGRIILYAPLIPPFAS